MTFNNCIVNIEVTREDGNIIRFDGVSLHSENGRETSLVQKHVDADVLGFVTNGAHYTITLHYNISTEEPEPYIKPIDRNIVNDIYISCATKHDYHVESIKGFKISI